MFCFHDHQDQLIEVFEVYEPQATSDNMYLIWIIIKITFSAKVKDVSRHHKNTIYFMLMNIALGQHSPTNIVTSAC